MLIFATLPLGLYMIGLELSPWKLKLYSWHKWIGVTLFMLAVLRLLWRWRHPAPPLPAGMQAWERHAAGVVHALLYLLLLAVPLSGWLMSSASGFQTVYLGVLPIPDLLEKDKELGEFLKWVHATLNWFLGLLLVGHIGAALKHEFVARDHLLARMLPRWNRH
jgi:cytochrome b561